MRRFAGSTSRTMNSISSEVETILPGWTFFLVQLISETWTRPSMPVLELDEGAVVGDVGDAALDLGAERVFGGDALPRILVELLHAERDALRLGVDADDLHLHGLADRQDVGGMVDALPGDVGDMQEAVDAAEIDERAVIGDVLDDAVDDLALGRFCTSSERCSARVSSMIARRDTTMLPRRRSILRIWKGCGHIHERPTSRIGTDIDLAAGQEGHGAAEIDGEAALDAAENHAVDRLVLAVGLARGGSRLPRGAPCRATAPLRRARSRCARDRPRPRRRSSAPTRGRAGRIP